MKLSVYRGEKGFQYAAGKGWQVTMDGRPLKRVVRVDTCAGVAWVADTDRDGNLRIDHQKEEVILRRVYGPMRASLPT